MKIKLRLLLMLAAVLSSAFHGEAARAGHAPDLSIRVEGTGWGSADKDDVAAVLYSVADALMPSPSRQPMPTIVVTHAEGNPETLYARDGRGEFRVTLSAKDRRWSQYVYQFGHELCHVLSHFDRHAGQASSNQWFEEAICEAAGRYSLEALARNWQRDPPYPDWEDYAPALQAYALAVRGNSPGGLPVGLSAAEWLKHNLATLRQDPYLRDRNDVVADLLLPLFARDPDGWAALDGLNAVGGNPGEAFNHYLQDWYRSVAVAQRSFVGEVLAALDVPLPALQPASGPAPASRLPAP